MKKSPSIPLLAVFVIIALAIAGAFLLKRDKALAQFQGTVFADFTNKDLEDLFKNCNMPTEVQGKFKQDLQKFAAKYANTQPIDIEGIPINLPYKQLKQALEKKLGGIKGSINVPSRFFFKHTIAELASPNDFRGCFGIFNSQRINEVGDMILAIPFERFRAGDGGNKLDAVEFNDETAFGGKLYLTPEFVAVRLDTDRSSSSYLKALNEKSKQWQLYCNGYKDSSTSKGVHLNIMMICSSDGLIMVYHSPSSGTCVLYFNQSARKRFLIDFCLPSLWKQLLQKKSR